MPTKDYIERHLEAYTNPNLTTWAQTGTLTVMGCCTALIYRRIVAEEQAGRPVLDGTCARMREDWTVMQPASGRRNINSVSRHATYIDDAKVGSDGLGKCPCISVRATLSRKRGLVRTWCG